MTFLPTRVLMTGSNGFIGRALGPALVKSGHTVRAAVRDLSGSKGIHPGAAPVGEIDGNTDWSQALLGVDLVIHLAARVHVMHDKESEPLAAFRTVNVEGSLNLAQQAAHMGVRRMVFLSSVKVNGESTLAKRAFSENDPAGPVDGYGLSKWEAEQGLHRIAAGTGMAVTIIRPPLVYGPGVKANFASLMRAVARGVPLPLGALHNRRSLVGLDNLVDFIFTCLTHPAAANQTFLVSDDEDLSTTDLVRRLGVAMEHPARLVPVPAKLLMAGARLLGRREATERLCGNLQVDISKARKLLGWGPPVSVDEGLRLAVVGLASMKRP